MSRRIDIRDAAIAALNTGTPSDVPQSGTRRWVPGLPLTEAQISVWFGKEDVTTPQNRSFGVASRTLILAVQCAIPLEDIELADDAVEPMLNWAVETLSLSTLGGLATNIREESTEWNPLKADLIYMVATVLFSVDYQTKRDDMDAEA